MPNLPKLPPLPSFDDLPDIVGKFSKAVDGVSKVIDGVSNGIDRLGNAFGPDVQDVYPVESSVSESSVASPTTEETVQELKRRLGKELYRIEMDLQGGARIAGKPCDCLSRAKHLSGVEATAEELMSYGVDPTYGRIIAWLEAHEREFEPAEIAKHPPEYYQSLAPEVREFRKEVMGTVKPSALLSDVDKQDYVKQKLAGLSPEAREDLRRTIAAKLEARPSQEVER